MSIIKQDFGEISGGDIEQLLTVSEDYSSKTFYFNLYNKDGTSDSTTLSSGSSLTWNGFTFSGTSIVASDSNNTISIAKNDGYHILLFDSAVTGNSVYLDSQSRTSYQFVGFSQGSPFIHLIVY